MFFVEIIIIIMQEDLESCVHIFHLVWNAREYSVSPDQVNVTYETFTIYISFI